MQTIHFWAPTFKWGISIANIAGAAGLGTMGCMAGQLSGSQQGQMTCSRAGCLAALGCASMEPSPSCQAPDGDGPAVAGAPPLVARQRLARTLSTPTCTRRPAADMQRPAELISYPQQVAITATGLIWSRFSTQITPVRAQG